MRDSIVTSAVENYEPDTEDAGSSERVHRILVGGCAAIAKAPRTGKMSRAGVGKVDRKIDAGRGGGKCRREVVDSYPRGMNEAICAAMTIGYCEHYGIGTYSGISMH